MKAAGGSRLDRDRVLRALALEVEPVGPRRWRVTGGGEPREVSQEGERLECRCPDREIRGAACKHVVAVAVELRHPAVLRELRELAAAGPGQDPEESEAES